MGSGQVLDGCGGEYALQLGGIFIFEEAFVRLAKRVYRILKRRVQGVLEQEAVDVMLEVLDVAFGVGLVQVSHDLPSILVSNVGVVRLAFGVSEVAAGRVVLDVQVGVEHHRFVRAGKFFQIPPQLAQAVDGYQLGGLDGMQGFNVELRVHVQSAVELGHLAAVGLDGRLVFGGELGGAGKGEAAQQQTSQVAHAGQGSKDLTESNNAHAVCRRCFAQRGAGVDFELKSNAYQAVADGGCDRPAKKLKNHRVCCTLKPQPDDHALPTPILFPAFGLRQFGDLSPSPHLVRRHRSAGV